MLLAFKPGYVCQSILLKIVEDWKSSFDSEKYTTILMDLSKAFDCIPHKSIRLVESYVVIGSSVWIGKCMLWFSFRSV
jgi:hypothetical protein